MTKKIILLTLLLSLLIVVPMVYSDDEVQLKLAEERIENSLNELSPTYTNVETTVYYTPSCEDKTSWCSPEKGSCFETANQIVDYYGDQYNVRSCVEDRRAGWCCIPEEHRGVYEEIKCQGSGVCQDCQGNICKNAVYYHSQLETTQADSVALNTEFQSGITSRQTDPKPKWTIAVNPSPNTPGHIPYGTLVYIFFSQNHPWNGIYKAEDTGSAFQGQAKIDIYAGVGRQARDEAIAQGVSGQRPLIFFLDEDLKLTEENEFGIQPSLGEYRASYQKTLLYDSPLNTFERARVLVNQSKDTRPENFEQLLENNEYESCLYKKPREIFEIQYPSSTPIYYKFETQWEWSPDKINWMSTDTLTVNAGKFKDRQPIQKHQEIINNLSTINSNYEEGNLMLYEYLKKQDPKEIYFLLEKEELELLLNIQDCIETRKDCYCNIQVNQKMNITQRNNNFYINNRLYRTNFLLELEGEKEFEFVFEDEFNLLIEEESLDFLLGQETFEQKIKIISKEELEKIANEFVDELDQEIFSSQGITGLVDDIIGIDLFSNIPFIDVATGFLNPSMLLTDVLLTQNFDIVSFASGKSISDIKNSLLDVDWLLDTENEESPINTCTAPNIHQFVCDKNSTLNFAIKLDYLE